MILALAIGVLAALVLTGLIVWSVAYPDRRIWPPTQSTWFNKQLVWGLTLTVCGSALYLGFSDWNGLHWPVTLRWPLGGVLVLAGNIAAWREVFHIGFEATSGGVDKLKTDGLYRFSRNPQYLGDMAILSGWFILSASLWVLPITLAGVVVLTLAPMAEEVWLEEIYGEDYRSYRRTVRRFI